MLRAGEDCPSYEGTWESVRTHRVPVWFDDAKLGIFIHWGLYSVPGWAPRVPDIQQLLVKDGPKRMLRENPYAEWYRNTMQLKGSPTAVHHATVYGDDYPYDNFVRTFNDASSGADLDAIAASVPALRAPATSCSPPSTTTASPCGPPPSAHPVKGEYQASRDLVGELTEAVRDRHMRMGLYYSGGYDWPYNDAVLSTGADAVLAAPSDARYVEYVTAHGVSSSTVTSRPCSGTTSRGRETPAAGPVRATTTTPWPRASSTIAGRSRACPAMR